MTKTDQNDTIPRKEKKMNKMLNISEIIRFAIKIEQAGYKFYVESLKRIQEPGILELFQYLADEEFKHENIFKNLLKKSGDFTPPESYQGEYNAYMKDFIESNLFRHIEFSQDKIDQIKDIKEAISLALDFERNSIVFYTALKRFIDGDNRQIIETIIQEELNHIFRINRFQQEYKLVL